ncbi:unnamed protein product [Fraxinus pennsylvanica]|uniref:Ycf3-interacting protein 1, chloroplastic n=1 Tax=Fraxinus pennsylvanica TaxID=56036 RepID=A0AAD1ZCV8_9LAMI|nr:unnamed protein product [Fraxinus pennsylvanica]
MGSLLLQSPTVAMGSVSRHRSLRLPLFHMPSIDYYHHHHEQPQRQRTRRRIGGRVFVNKEDTGTEMSVTSSTPLPQGADSDPDLQDLEYVSQIKRVLELLRKNRDMLFNEVKLTDELAAVLVEVNEGKIPKDRVALQMLAEEITQWPSLKVEITPKKKRPGKSLYAKVTDTGIDPREAAKRLNIDWDSAAEIEDAEADEVEVPSAVGYGALYLVTAFPVIIGISVVLILFYNSLQ